MKETELAEKVVDWLRLDGWEVYQEVQMYGYGSRTADIVAVKKFYKTEIIWIIECKTSMTASLCEQAHYWNHYWTSHYVSIAVPVLKRQRSFWFLSEALRDHGIGILEVNNSDMIWCREDKEKDLPSLYVNEELSPKLFRTRHNIRKKTLDKLHEQHKTFAKAGNADGKKFTAFQHTIQQIQDFIKRQPGSTMDEVLERIYHHYSSKAGAKSSLYKWINSGVIKNIELRREKNREPFKLYYKESSE